MKKLIIVIILFMTSCVKEYNSAQFDVGDEITFIPDEYKGLVVDYIVYSTYTIYTIEYIDSTNNIKKTMIYDTDIIESDTFKK
tara:strand:+ start:1514 stop:1762 length:249 start_codon:yes stop_codon:yes gene_type:complete